MMNIIKAAGETCKLTSIACDFSSMTFKCIRIKFIDVTECVK